jgi:agmatinase
LRAIRTIVLAKGLVGMDVVEVSPPYDHASITALAANRVVQEALSALALRKAGRAPAPENP